MKPRGRILLGLALGFLVPLLWLGFRALFFPEGTVTSESFKQRADWFDGAATALLGWMVGSIFAGGFSLQALGDLFGNPSKTLQPAVSNLVGSRLWHAVGLFVLAVEIAGIVQARPRRLPDLEPGLAWYHESQGRIADEAHAQRRSLHRIGAYLESTASEAESRRVPLAIIERAGLFGRLEKTFTQVTVVTDESAGCAELAAAPVPVNTLLSHPCLAGFADALATAIANGKPWTSREGGLDLALAPGLAPRLTIKQAGVLADGKLRSLLARWQKHRLLMQRDERSALEDAAAAIGTETLTEELVAGAIETLLPAGPAWELPVPVKAARLSSLLRLVAACHACSRAERSTFFDQLVEPVRAKLVRSGPKGGVVLIDGTLAREWGRIAGWWAEELQDSKVLDVALSSLKGCGAEAHLALLETLGSSGSDYLEPETRGVLKARFAHYSRSSKDVCGAVVAKAQVENAAWGPLFTEWMTEAVHEQTSCDLRTVLYGAGGGAL